MISTTQSVTLDVRHPKMFFELGGQPTIGLCFPLRSPGSLLFPDNVFANWPVSFSEVYFTCVMFEVGASVICTVVVLNFHHRNAEAYFPMPNWVGPSPTAWDRVTAALPELDKVADRRCTYALAMFAFRCERSC